MTLYLVAYDIPDDRRRTRIHKTLCGFGSWTQFSLFECHLDAKELILMQKKLHQLLDKSADNLRIYRICDGCAARVETIGSAPPAEPKVYLL